MILAIDPGPVESAFVLYDESKRKVTRSGKWDNASLLHELKRAPWDGHFAHVTSLAVEMIASYGMPVGAEVFETCVVIGRIVEAWALSHDLIYRRIVKNHLCGSMKAKDSNVRQALIDAFGGKQKAIGNKAQPGPLYGIKGDVWQALAVAVTYADQQEKAQEAA